LKFKLCNNFKYLT